MEIDLKSIALEAFKKQVLDTMTPEDQQELIGKAVQDILKASSGYGFNREQYDFNRDVMRPAVQEFMRGRMAELLGRPENSEIIEAAVNKALAKFMEDFPEKFAEAISRAMWERQ